MSDFWCKISDVMVSDFFRSVIHSWRLLSSFAHFHIFIFPDFPHFLKNNYQLVSRILFLNYHLSGRRITVAILLPTLPVTSADVVNEPLTWSATEHKLHH